MRLTSRLFPGHSNYGDLPWRAPATTPEQHVETPHIAMARTQ